MTRLSDLPDDGLAALARRLPEDLPNAPPWLVESAIAMWRAPVVEAPSSSSQSLGSRIAAALAFDSWAPGAMLATRSSVPTARQLLFSAAGRDVDLRITAEADAPGETGGSYALSGQVLGVDDGGTLSLAGSGGLGPLRSVPLDDFGEFAFAGVPAGRYVVTLCFGADRIVLPEVDVGAEPPG